MKTNMVSVDVADLKPGDVISWYFSRREPSLVVDVVLRPENTRGSRVFFVSPSGKICCFYCYPNEVVWFFDLEMK